MKMTFLRSPIAMVMFFLQWLGNQSPQGLHGAGFLIYLFFYGVLYSCLMLPPGTHSRYSWIISSRVQVDEWSWQHLCYLSPLGGNWKIPSCSVWIQIWVIQNAWMQSTHGNHKVTVYPKSVLKCYTHVQYLNLEGSWSPLPVTNYFSITLKSWRVRQVLIVKDTISVSSWLIHQRE